MELNELLTQIAEQPEQVAFADVISVIDANYDFTPTAFENGDLHNEANQNNGSCKIFSFASLHTLSPEQTLACFGDFYRKDVLGHPDNDDHQNIRNFMQYGWEGVKFAAKALSVK
ncbi:MULTISPECIES: HopJ type III effector protein [Vibrio]|uniref:HopJ type III effector protein n=1 Tax=Vibrio ostreae TaxID=2841925 RepID=A0A975YM39_9VIBR|nr:MULTISPECIES: HopJ type III effector protein [Vibrio]QXO16035.1 HopJ type III effector protein [Vibrio ostreae]WGY44800.1 HopJ type III effector protein [Vibrio sp. ABG19]